MKKRFSDSETEIGKAITSAGWTNVENPNSECVGGSEFHFP